MAKSIFNNIIPFTMKEDLQKDTCGGAGNPYNERIKRKKDDSHE
jgi:hypothetical protein